MRRISTASEVVRITLALLLTAAAVLYIVAEAARLTGTDRLFGIADNVIPLCAVLGAAFVLLDRPARSPEVDSPTDQITPHAVGCGDLVLALIALTAVVLRTLAPGSDLLALIAPLVILFAPGWSIAGALAFNGWTRALIAVPLSLTTQLIVVLWLAALGVPLTPPLFFTLAAVIALIGVGARWGLARRAP